MTALATVTIYGIAFLLAWCLGEMQLRSKKLADLQLHHMPNLNSYQQRKPLIAFNFVVVCLVAGAAVFIFDSIITWSTSMGWWLITAQFAFVVVADDAWFYMVHRLLHENKYLFKKIHSIHHRVRSPLPLDHVYVHPLEWMIGSVGIVISVVALYLILGEISGYALLAYFAFRVLHEIDVHSGLRSYFSNKKLFAWFGSTEHHALHHIKFRGNYASTLKIWDKILKTEL